MGEWVIGAFINLFGSIAINFGTNLLKLGHDERERHSVIGSEGTNGKAFMKPIVYFQTWRIGIIFFILGNCLNFISFGYAAQSLLAALGSVQFVSNIAFAYFVLSKTVSVKVLVATTFIVLGNIFLVAFGNHQSPVYTPEELAEKYSNTTFLIYCLTLVIVVCFHHTMYRRGELLLSVPGNDIKPYWQMLLPLSYAIVSGAVGSCSVLFAKSLSNLLRLSMSSGYQLHSWFTYSMLLLFFSTAGFWMARLNEGLSLFDAILIVPMFQIVWTFFSICTGFVYFQEYQVFDALRTTMFILGMVSVFIGICLLAPDELKGGEVKDTPLVSVTASHPDDLERLPAQTCATISVAGDVVEWAVQMGQGRIPYVNSLRYPLYAFHVANTCLAMAVSHFAKLYGHNYRFALPSEDSQIKDTRSLVRMIRAKAADMIVKIKAACSLTLGLGEESIHTSSVLVMPMVSSKLTGFRGSTVDRNKLFSFREKGWNRIDEDAENLLQATTLVPQTIK